ATASVPSTPPWPPRLSITTGCFVSSDMRWPITRAMMSLGPPAGNGTTSRIALLGNSCAAAKAGQSSKPNQVSRTLEIFMKPPGADVFGVCRDRACIANPTGARGVSAVQQLHRLFMHARIAGGDDAAAALGRSAVPGGDDAAGPGDDRDQGGDIVGFQLGLDHEVEMAGGEHAVGIAVAAIARQSHRLLDTAEHRAVGFVHQQRAGGVGGRLFQRGATPHRELAFARRPLVMRRSAVARETLADI